MNGKSRELGNGEVVTYEPIGRDYSPNDEEVVYDARAEQFYQVILQSSASDEQEDMIFFLPLPGQTSAIPITDVADEIALAMDRDAFYRVTVNPEAIFHHEIWCQTAKATAPKRGKKAEKTDRSGAQPESGTTDEEMNIPQKIDDEWGTPKFRNSDS